MSQADPHLNPYAPAAAVELEPIPSDGEHETWAPGSLPRIGVRWLVVCSLSAIPSFVFGLAVTKGQAAAMITGIFMFVVGYTLLDYRTAHYPIRRKKTVQRTLRIAYGTRIAISILFPVGMYVDIFCGMLSVGLTQSVTGTSFSESERMSFVATLLTTLVQGVVLNIVLGGYALLVHAAQMIVLALRR